jgi:Histidine kinase-like ATPase domain
LENVSLICREKYTAPIKDEIGELPVSCGHRTIFALPTFDSIEDAIGQIMFETAKHDISDKESVMFGFALHEILLNALEHGILGVNCEQKTCWIEEGVYDDKILELMNGKGIQSRTIKIEYEEYGIDGVKAIGVGIADGGDGFDILSYLARQKYSDSSRVNGRGIAMCLEVLDGVYFNQKGNETLVLKQIKKGKNEN